MPSAQGRGRPAQAADQAQPQEEGGSALAVTGCRMTDASQSISEDQVPGFSVQADGALGVYEFGNRVQTRAYNLDQIGFGVER